MQYALYIPTSMHACIPICSTCLAHRRGRMVHQRKLEAARELYGLSPTDEIPEDELKAQAKVAKSGGGGNVSASDYGLGFGEEAESEEKLVEVAI